MKKNLLFLFSFVLITHFSIAQTITVDGDVSDWAEVPILSEPGVFPYAKAHVTNDFLYYMIEVEDTEETHLDAGVSNYFIGLVDADGDKETGQNHWVYPDAGIDYFISNVPHFWNGSEHVWKWYPIDTVGTKTAAEAGVEKTKLITVPDQPEEAKIPLAESFGLALRYKVGGTDLYFPENNWDFAYRNLMSVKPRTIADLGNDNPVKLSSSNAYYLPFMKDENIEEYLDFQSGGYSSQNPDHWASWAIKLTQPAVYNVNMTFASEDGGKIQFFLIDMATNDIVFSTEEKEIWYANHQGLDFKEQENLTSLDFSKIDPGNYMLKIKNATTWGAYLKVEQLKLINPTQVSVPEQSLAKNYQYTTSNGGFVLNATVKADINIYSLNGSKVYTKDNVQHAEVTLSKGVYLVEIVQNGISNIEKIIL